MSESGRRVHELGSKSSSMVAATAVILIPAVSTSPTYLLALARTPSPPGVSAVFGIVTPMRPLPMLPPASLSRTALDRNHSLRSAGIDAVWETGRARAVVGHRGNLLI